jgi:phosphopantetheinyl transferase (holo-ACP synthase)
MSGRLAQVVGNDVIDMDDPAVAEHHRRERFVSRVCSAEERERVASALDLWGLFAAKEAAYKALVKLGHSPGFAHREILVASDLRTVCWRGHVLALSLTSQVDYVHAVAWSASAPRPHAKVARAEGPESEAARALLCELVAATADYAATDLVVVRDSRTGAWDGFGPPRVEHRGATIEADVSISHDGKFVAAAALFGARLALSG